MNIIYKVVSIIFAIFLTVIIISIEFNSEYFMINNTAFFRILSILVLISLWLPFFIKTNCLLKFVIFLLFILYFILYIAHPLL